MQRQVGEDSSAGYPAAIIYDILFTIISLLKTKELISI